MRALSLGSAQESLCVLCLGAHSDDIEIGAGGTLLSLAAGGAKLDVLWLVLSGRGARSDEARASAHSFLEGVVDPIVTIADFDDSYFPTQGREIKEWLASEAKRIRPDLIFTHRRDDAHQDHREVNKITWNLFRDHLILEYEIPKWDGDLGQPNFYMPLSEAQMQRKTELLLAHFGSQRSKDWFDAETFRGLARLRGMECRAKDGFAEGFVVRKASWSFG
jgi:LmbE family N-acetylglucosaminyl deacetylase